MGKRSGNGGCENCVYHGFASGQVVCEYILHTKKRRPCPAGPGCAVFVGIGEAHAAKNPRDIDPDYMWSDEKMKTREWDTERARQLFEEGKSDLEIADMVGTTKAAVSLWRSRNGLARKRGARKVEGCPPATTSDVSCRTTDDGEDMQEKAGMPPAEPSHERKAASAPVKTEETAVPVEVKGVKLNLSFAGCEVEIWADAMSDAVGGCELALKMLRGAMVHENA